MTVNPIPDANIFDYLLDGGGRCAPPPLTSALFEIQKIQRQFWKACKKSRWVSFLHHNRFPPFRPAKTGNSIFGKTVTAMDVVYAQTQIALSRVSYG